MTKMMKFGLAGIALAALTACNPVGTAVGAAANVTTGVVTTATSTAVGIVL